MQRFKEEKNNGRRMDTTDFRQCITSTYQSIRANEFASVGLVVKVPLTVQRARNLRVKENNGFLKFCVYINADMIG